jgi:type IV fimbrial biogenesis protein FimT
MTKSNGFTMIELATVMAIVAVMAAVAAPNMGIYLQNSRIKDYSSELLSSINIARSEAIKMRINAVLCRSANPTADSPTCGGTVRIWESGWILFLDADEDGVFDAGETLIRRGDKSPNNMTIRSNAAAQDNLIFSPKGSTDMAGLTARLVVCDEREEIYGREIRVMPMGHAAITVGSKMAPLADCTP